MLYNSFTARFSEDRIENSLQYMQYIYFLNFLIHYLKLSLNYNQLNKLLPLFKNP